MESLETRARWLREARLTAGITTAAELARKVGASPVTARKWENPNQATRPRWRYIKAIADLLDTDVGEVVLQLWGERIGDPCPCGCGGIKAQPTHPETARLATSLPCRDCGKLRLYRWHGLASARRFHHERCHACGGGNWSDGPQRITVTCVGYDDHGVIRHAPSCPRTRKLVPWQILEYHSQQSQHKIRGGASRLEGWQRPFLDEESGTTRCHHCALGSLATLRLDIEIKEVTGTRVRSASGRQRALKERVIGEDLQKTPLLHDLVGRFATPTPARIRSKVRSQADRDAIVKGKLVRAWSGPVLPKVYTFGYCACGKLTIIQYWGNWPASEFPWHRRCHLEAKPRRRPWLRRRPPVGKPTSPEVLKRHFAWAIQHYLGDRSYRNIAKQEGVSHQSVDEAVERIIDSLPDPELVGTRLRHRIRLLLQAARPELT